MSVLFKGLNHSPVGGATVALSGPNLLVSNIGSSGLDGVQIDLIGKNNLHVVHDGILLGSGKAMNMTLFVKDDTDLSFPIASIMKVYNAVDNCVDIKVNNGLLPSTFHAVASANGTNVYDEVITNEPGGVLFKIGIFKSWFSFGVSIDTEENWKVTPEFDLDLTIVQPSIGPDVTADTLGYNYPFASHGSYSNLQPHYLLVQAQGIGSITITDETYVNW